MLTREFLKKYISFAKSQKNPEIENDTVEYAASAYSYMRLVAQNTDQDKVAVPITVRTLETMIRLATAHSKLRLSKHVAPEDIDVAIQLMNFCIFGNESEEDKEEKAKKSAKKKAPSSKDKENREVNTRSKREPDSKRARVDPVGEVKDLVAQSTVSG